MDNNFSTYINTLIHECVIQSDKYNIFPSIKQTCLAEELLAWPVLSDFIGLECKTELML